MRNNQNSFLGHVTDYQPITEQYFLFRSVSTYIVTSQDISLGRRSVEVRLIIVDTGIVVEISLGISLYFPY